MPHTISRTYGVQTVIDIQPSNGATVLTFQPGQTATLPGDHPDRETILREAERSLRGRKPVGVIVDEGGRLIELSPAQHTLVRSLRDDEDGDRLVVACWGFGPITYLRRGHLEWDRITATLGNAVASRNLVWLANRTRMVQGETEIWWEILDVRPDEAVGHQ